ncbi:acyl-CoA dehydrogenase [Halieaceae bacterium IMCC14734]|uniref:Acyl-CoA dehydrogenase n=1 Tax=Candidatus Litorirhabdus singularis TaxID=2518993 RepID=A0ABT3TJU3_9GAMM|nr:acyl-CoA/acyl-ACP dehydrogenase [Candidatus Litorirhabdus singularis]MCX2982587.1 acyl-CoA dehydrogenase [Candidatus Litorirhabdus singularis]
MDFGFSEQQGEVQTLARQILSEQVTPERLAAYDEFKAERFDRELWQQLAQAGLLGVALEESHGGMGFGFTELALFIEEVGRSIAPVPVIPHLVSAAAPIQRFGSSELQGRWLPGVASGDVLLTAALMEPGNEEPAAPSLTTATLDGDGYRVSGLKTCVPFARSADRILLSAAVDGGVVVLLVDPKSAGISLEDVRYSTYETQYQLTLQDVQVSAADVLAGPTAGAAVMQWLSLRTTAALCAHQLGVTDHSMRMTASYSAERKQFGVLIGTFQAVGHRAANCYIDVECLRLNTYQAASLLASEADATNEVQIAKVWAGDVGHRVSYASQHLHGGTGIDRDYPLWRYCLWARHNEMMLGGSARQLAALGARIAAGEAYCA